MLNLKGICQLTRIAEFFEFVYDRQEVWHRRNVLKTPAPWSADEVLQNYRFCNVYRELDGGTLALTKYLSDKTVSAEKKLFNIAAYRFFNRRDTIEKLFGGLLEPKSFDFGFYEKRFDACKREGSLFSNAYLISSHPYNASYRPKDKHIQILLMLADLAGKMSDFCRELSEAPAACGLSVVEKYVAMAGPFLSGQILLDATYAGNIVGYTANDFLVVGPGAHWGLNIIFGRKLNKREAEEKCRYLYSVQAEEMEKLQNRTGKNWDAVRWQNPDYCGGRYLALHDIQNSLCEFRKYWRLKNGEKAKKRYYVKKEPTGLAGGSSLRV